jgi:hypothetical protein
VQGSETDLRRYRDNLEPTSYTTRITSPCHAREASHVAWNQSICADSSPFRRANAQARERYVSPCMQPSSRRGLTISCVFINPLRPRHTCFASLVVPHNEQRRAVHSPSVSLCSILYIVRAGSRSALRSLNHQDTQPRRFRSLRHYDTTTPTQLVIMKYISALPIVAGLAAAQMQVMSLAPAAASGPATHTVRLPSPQEPPPPPPLTCPPNHLTLATGRSRRSHTRSNRHGARTRVPS